MIVPAMTLDEIRKEFDKDFPIMHRKASYTGLKVRKQYRPHGDDLITKIYDYYSKYKNHWLYRVEISKKEQHFAFLVYFFSAKGLSAILPLSTSNTLVYFTSHYIVRYNERRKLNLVQPHDIMKVMLDEIHRFHAEPVEKIKGGVDRMFTVMESGVGLGVQNDITHWLHMNTFLSNDMLKGDQVEKMKRIREEFEIPVVED